MYTVKARSEIEGGGSYIEVESFDDVEALVEFLLMLTEVGSKILSVRKS